MNSNIRLLGIAPYENMKPLMLEVAEEYDDVELTVFVGDLQQGVELARRNFCNDYDAIISRGGTAAMLRERLDLPVVEIPISPFDIMRAMKLAENVSDRYAIVGFPNITASAQMLCQMMQYQIDIYSIQSVEEVEPTLISIRKRGTRAILCDMVAHTTAMRLGLDVVLITSGAEGIRSAFEEALRLHRNYRALREENRFLRSLIWNQINQTVVFNDKGELFFSTLEDHASPIMDYLCQESERGGEESVRHILKQIQNVQYSIRLDHETFGGHRYTTYYFSESRVPLADIRKGIRYVGQPEAEEQYNNSLYGIVGLMRTLQDQIVPFNRTDQPILVCGEDGTCKEQAVNYLYLQSARRDRPLVIIDCFMLNEKAWNYLMDHHNSPLTQSGCTIFVKNVDVLTGEKRKQMLANLLAMDVCKRNRMIFSCVCRTGELVTEAGMEFVEGLFCLTLYLPPARQRAAQLPAVANMYLSHLNTIQAKQVAGLEPEALRQLQAFEWPHNYTQFQRILKELSLMSEGTYITAQEVGQILKRERTVGTFHAGAEDAGAPLNLNRTLEQINREIARRVLAEENGNQSKTAQRLGIGRTTLWRMLNAQK
ncbi:MAG: PrpR N-terminal domain-containing protein [Lawsonibacter sp.]